VSSVHRVRKREMPEMDELNKKAVEVLETEGAKEFVKHVFTDPKDSKKTLSYAEMRMLYG
jgi:hypothetical protein